MAKRRSNRIRRERHSAVLFQMVVGKWISEAIVAIVEIGVPKRGDQPDRGFAA